MRRRVGEPLAIELEMAREKVSGLARVASRLESLLEEIAQVELRAAKAQGPALERLREEHARLRAEAGKQRWYLIVQREAMGLYHHGDVERIYPTPRPLQAT